MRQAHYPYRSLVADRRDTRRFTVIIALIALVVLILLAAPIAPGATPRDVLWLPAIRPLTAAVRLYLGRARW